MIWPRARNWSVLDRRKWVKGLNRKRVPVTSHRSQVTGHRSLVTGHPSLRLDARLLRQLPRNHELLGDELVELRRRARRRLDADGEQALLDVRRLQGAGGFLVQAVDDGARGLRGSEQRCPRVEIGRASCRERV